VVLVDTAVWIDHLRFGDARLAELLMAGEVLAHPYVVGEVALGNLRNRDDVLGLMDSLPMAALATDAEVRVFIDSNRLMGSGIGYIDAHLLASTAIMAPARLWTSDRRLDAVARRLGLARG